MTEHETYIIDGSKTLLYSYKSVTNLDLSEKEWMKFSREGLREIARQNNILRGRNKSDTAHNLSRGIVMHSGVPVEGHSFRVSIHSKCIVNSNQPLHEPQCI